MEIILNICSEVQKLYRLFIPFSDVVVTLSPVSLSEMFCSFISQAVTHLLMKEAGEHQGDISPKPSRMKVVLLTAGECSADRGKVITETKIRAVLLHFLHKAQRYLHAHHSVKEQPLLNVPPAGLKPQILLNLSTAAVEASFHSPFTFFFFYQEE